MLGINISNLISIGLMTLKKLPEVRKAAKNSDHSFSKPSVASKFNRPNVANERWTQKVIDLWRVKNDL